MRCVLPALAVVCALILAGLCHADYDSGGMGAAKSDAQANKPKPEAVRLLVNDDGPAGMARAFALVCKARRFNVMRQPNRHRPANVPSSRYSETRSPAKGANVEIEWIRWGTLGNDVIDW